MKIRKVLIDFNKKIKQSFNSNVIFSLNDYKLLKIQKIILLIIIKYDKRVLDFFYDKKNNEIDVIVGLDYCNCIDMEV